MRILITGASSDIGRAMIEDRLKKGDQILSTVSDSKTLRTAGKSFSSKKLDLIPFDLGNPEKNEVELKAWTDEGLDAIALNAWTRVPKLRLLGQHRLDFIRNDLRTNVEGNLFLIHSLLPQLLKSKNPRLIFISSLSSSLGMPFYSSYAAGKAAIESVIRSLSVEYGSDGLRANSIQAGFIETSRNEKARDAKSGKKISALIPAGALGKPSEIVEAVNFLLSENCYMNGHSLPVAGGLPLIDWRGVIRS